MSKSKYQIWLLGYKFKDEDMEIDDYSKFIGETDSLFEARQLAVSISNTRLTLDTDSDVVMIQVQAVVELDDGSELCVDVDYERQVEFMKGKEK